MFERTHYVTGIRNFVVTDPTPISSIVGIQIEHGEGITERERERERERDWKRDCIYWFESTFFGSGIIGKDDEENQGLYTRDTNID